MKDARAAEALRPELEEARLELRALFRALDRLRLAQRVPPELRRLLELDADFAEALWVLDHAPADLDWAAMLRDSRASLARVSASRTDFLSRYDGAMRAEVAACEKRERSRLSPRDAYLDMPDQEQGAG